MPSLKKAERGRSVARVLARLGGEEGPLEAARRYMSRASS